jgi:hypothetical protein
MTSGSALLARRALAAIRLVNGTLAVVAPRVMLRRLGTDPVEDPSGVYPLRMFGVRTVLIGVDLLVRGDTAREVARRGILIHACDAAAAAAAGVRGDLPRRVAVAATALSGLNAVLAVVGSSE